MTKALIDRSFHAAMKHACAKVFVTKTTIRTIQYEQLFIPENSKKKKIISLKFTQAKQRAKPCL